MSGNENSPLLQLAFDLCQKLNVREAIPDRVVWTKLFDTEGNPVDRKWARKGDQTVSYHTPVLWNHVLILPSVMEGRLEPEDWEPLIASSVMYWGQLRSRENSGAVLRLVPTLVLLGFLFSGFVFRFSFFSNPPFLVGYIASVIVAVVFFAASSASLRSKMHLVADSKAADLLGREFFIEVLNKVEGLKQYDLESGRDKRASWPEGDDPKVAKRIENLQSAVNVWSRRGWRFGVDPKEGR